MNKKILIIAMICILVVSNMTVVNAAVTLTCFYGNFDEIGYNPGRLIYSINHDGFSSSDFNTYLNYSKNQWGYGGISTTYVSRLMDSTIDIHGGKMETLKALDSDIEYYYALTVMKVLTYKETTSFQGRDIDVYTIGRAMILCPKYSIFTSANDYRNMFTHELGHGLGWLGHSTNTSDVMQKSPSGARISLTTRDINHVKQMY